MMVKRNSRMEAAISAPLDPILDPETLEPIGSARGELEIPNSDEIKIYEAEELLSEGRLKDELGRKAVVVSRGFIRNVTDDRFRFTFIEGFDHLGQNLCVRTVRERESSFGKRWQRSVEKLQVMRVKRELGRKAVPHLLGCIGGAEDHS